MPPPLPPPPPPLPIGFLVGLAASFGSVSPCDFPDCLSTGLPVFFPQFFTFKKNLSFAPKNNNIFPITYFCLIDCLTSLLDYVPDLATLLPPPPSLFPVTRLERERERERSPETSLSRHLPFPLLLNQFLFLSSSSSSCQKKTGRLVCICQV